MKSRQTLAAAIEATLAVDDHHVSIDQELAMDTAMATAYRDGWTPREVWAAIGEEEERRAGASIAVGTGGGKWVGRPVLRLVVDNTRQGGDR